MNCGNGNVEPGENCDPPDPQSGCLSLLLDHVPGREGQAVADPYYGDAAGFEITWTEVTAGAEGLLRLIRA